MIPSGNLSFVKRTLVGWMYVWDLNPGGLGSFWLKASMIGVRWAVPLLNYALAFALQLMKSAENLNQVSRIVLDTNRCVDLAALLRAASTGLLGIVPPPPH
jgi:hypothetical protein